MAEVPVVPVAIAVGSFVADKFYSSLASRRGSDSARSIGVMFKNLTDETLWQTSISISHGQWTDNAGVPMSIQPQTVVGWMCESDGFLTGCEGTAEFAIGSAGGATNVYLSFDNPYSGSNSYTVEMRDNSAYKISYTGGGGDNAEVVITFEKA